MNVKRQVIYAWEQSGNGFGQGHIKNDRSWGHFTEEHQKAKRL